MSIGSQVQRIHDVTLLASNVHELGAFYERLGLTHLFSQGDDLAVFQLGKNELAIHRTPHKPSEALVLSMVVSSLSAVESHLKELGLHYDGPTPLRPGLLGISVRDPNGNKLEFLAPASG